MKQEITQDITVTSKGQLTLPVAVRRAFKLNSRRKVRMSVTKDGAITLRPLPDVMELFGILKSKVPYSPDEKRRAREAMAEATMKPYRQPPKKPRKK